MKGVLQSGTEVETPSTGLAGIYRARRGTILSAPTILPTSSRHVRKPNSIHCRPGAQAFTSYSTASFWSDERS